LNLAAHSQSKVFSIINKLVLSLLMIMAVNSAAYADETKTTAVQFEYAVFYMETEGEFVIPVSADAPAIYSWSEPGGSIKGDIPQIWQYLGINKEVEYSFTDVESTILNHVASKGWQLQDLEITSVPISTSDTDFRTAYRYIFKRKKEN